MGSKKTKNKTHKHTHTKKTHKKHPLLPLRNSKSHLLQDFLLIPMEQGGLAPAWSEHRVMPEKLLDIGFSLTLDLPYFIFLYIGI